MSTWAVLHLLFISDSFVLSGMPSCQGGGGGSYASPGIITALGTTINTLVIRSGDSGVNEQGLVVIQ